MAGRIPGRSNRWVRFSAFCLALSLVLGAGARPCGAGTPCVFTGVDKVIAVGDLHGDYQNFVKILTRTHVVDQGLHWIAGRAHLVQIGDVLDRGPSARKIFDLIARLEKEAEQAGGKVHALLGNHEEMALAGISFDYPGFVTVEQFLSFLPDTYIDMKQTEYLRKKSAGLPPGAEPPLISLTELLDYWKGIMTSDATARREYFQSLYDLYGAWILSHNAVIKINDTVFVHGGISEPFSEEPLETINDDLRRELSLAMRGSRFTPRIIFTTNSPLWYRGLALNDESSMKDELDRILSNLKAKHMVVGHTTHGFGTARTMERFQGKVWCIDTGISEYFGGHLSALIIEKHNFEPWGVNSGTN
jgi:hypothetical protein